MQLESSNLAIEFRSIVRQIDLDAVQAWMRDRCGPQYGIHLYERSHLYFDTGSRNLLQRDIAFRKSLRSPKYCLVELEICEGYVLRHESFLTCDRPLDTLDCFDRSSILVRKLLHSLSSTEEVLTVVPDDFRHVLSLDQHGEIFSVFSECGSKLLHVMLNRNTAHRLAPEGLGQAADWLEIEVGASNSFDARNTLVESFAGELNSLLGGRWQAKTKYATACELLDSPSA